MGKSENIFYKISKENEDSVTQLLVNLMSAKYISDIVLETMGIERAIYSQICSDDIRPHYVLDDAGRPDIVIEKNDILIFIENKIRKNTNLQESQTTTYIENLRNTDKKYVKMIYLIPEGYIHKSVIDKATKDNNFCATITWENLLESLYESNITKWNPLIDETLDHFSNLVLKKEIGFNLTNEEIVIMFNGKDLKNANGLFVKTKKLINKIDRLIIEGLGGEFSSSSWLWDDNSIHEKGKYINHSENYDCIFYGFNFDIGSEHPDYVFSVAIKKEVLNLESKSKYIKENSVNDGDWYYFKIDKYNLIDFENEQKISENIINIIKSSV